MNNFTFYQIQTLAFLKMRGSIATLIRISQCRCEVTRKPAETPGSYDTRPRNGLTHKPPENHNLLFLHFGYIQHVNQRALEVLVVADLVTFEKSQTCCFTLIPVFLVRYISQLLAVYLIYRVVSYPLIYMELFICPTQQQYLF